MFLFRKHETPPLSYFFHTSNLMTIVLYITFLMSIFLNLYVLLSRDDTIYYLRIYHVTVAGLMLMCVIIQLEFIVRTRSLPKLDEPHEIPVPALIGAIALTIGIVIGYFYFIIFNYSFSGCDKLVDALYGSEIYLDVTYSGMMIVFSACSLVYVLQRRYYGAISSHLDKVGRLWINLTFCTVWMKVVIYKGYLSHHELCHRHELEGYWCPVLKRQYECDPANDLHGTQKIWYYVNKGLLNTSVISCASEFFPVLLIAHWLACGGAEEKAEDIRQRRVAKQGFRSLMRDFMKNISRVYTTDEVSHNFPPLFSPYWLKIGFNIFAIWASACMIARWMVFFNYAIEFDEHSEQHSIGNDVVSVNGTFFQLAFFIAVFVWAKSISNERLDAHHKASARGDVIILFGCSVVLAIKCILQIIEYSYQHKDGFLYTREAAMRIVTLICVHASQWIQYLAVRRLLALNDRDIKATTQYLPAISLAGVLLAWIHFSVTFFETTTIKYTLTEEKFRFTPTTLVSMIFTQTIYPADYLYAFTASGCWLEILIRYLEIGFFQIGHARLYHHGHGGHGGHGEHEGLAAHEHHENHENHKNHEPDDTGYEYVDHNEKVNGISWH